MHCGSCEEKKNQVFRHQRDDSAEDIHQGWEDIISSLYIIGKLRKTHIQPSGQDGGKNKCGTGILPQQYQKYN